MKILLFTDSRGQHKPAGHSHQLFGERLRADSRLIVDLFLCPMKWTTTLDFLENFPIERCRGYDAVVLYTGIVDWSPRPLSSAVRDLYDNASTINVGNLALNTNDYAKKVVNNKKRSFDAVFGEEEMRRHFARPFDTLYEGEQTANMYGLGMARRSLVPLLQAIPNLIFISANRFVPGWNGDYRRQRPSNIDVTHAYSDLFSEALGEKVIDLRAWQSDDVKRFTCDNIHLTSEGSEYVYQALVAKLGLRSRARVAHPQEHKKEPQVMSQGHMEALLSANRALRSGNFKDAFNKAWNAFRASGRSPHFHTAFRAAIASGNDEDLERLLSAAEQLPFSQLDPGLAEEAYLRRLQFLLPQSTQQRVLELAKRPALSADQLKSLEAKLGTPGALAEFVDSRVKLVRTRMTEEFLLLPRFKLPFPYNYLWDYKAGKPVPRRDQAPRVRSVTFIYPVKDRTARLAASLQSLARAVRLLNSLGSRLAVDVVVSEDQSAAVAPASVFEGLPFDCTHRVVNTGVRWTRSGLLNQGLKVAKGQFVFFTDVDVLFPETVLAEMERVFEEVDANVHAFALNMFETHTHAKEGKVHTAGMPYSYMWGLLRKHAIAVGGFSESYVGWGSEDRDFEFRVCKRQNLAVLGSLQMPGGPFVLHLSHDVRTGSEDKASNESRLRAMKGASSEANELVAKPALKVELIQSRRYKTKPEVRETRPDLFHSDEERRRKTLVILGNGPSLKEVMETPELRALVRAYDSFGLNAAYRAYERFDFFPTYFGSFDYRVCDSHAASFAELVKNDWPIKRFFFAKQSVFPDEVKAHPKFQRINFMAAPRGVSQQKTLSKSFEHFEDCGSSGTNAVQAGYLMGYRHFILLGVDCNYVEMLEGVKDLDGIRYEVVGEIKSNPNYWFDDYQRQGDQFHKPNEKDIQLVSWAKLDALIRAEQGHISNCSMVSKLPMYDILPLRLRGRKFRNVFLVISCQKYRHRIEALRPRYTQALHPDDLALFVVGGASTTRLEEDGTLMLNAGDGYEDLPQKVQAAVEFCVENLQFERVIKVDDDVFVNFGNLYRALDDMGERPYVGRRTPTRAGVKPSSVWHFGKVSEGSLDEGLPFEVEPPPEMWAGGGLYVLARSVAGYLAGAEARRIANHHLYEDFMVGDVLARQGVIVAPWDQIVEAGRGDWCITNLKEILTPDLTQVADVQRAKHAISVHCGPYQPYYGIDENQLSGLFAELEGVL